MKIEILNVVPNANFFLIKSMFRTAILTAGGEPDLRRPTLQGRRRSERQSGPPS